MGWERKSKANAKLMDMLQRLMRLSDEETVALEEALDEYVKSLVEDALDYEHDRGDYSRY